MVEISIVVPAYNAEKFLSKCLDSLIQQTHSLIQIIVVDDGSTDNTFSIAQKYVGFDSRIELIHQENRGLSGARNTGLESARGEFVVFIDSDDWVEPDMLEKMLNEAELSNADVVVSGAFVDFLDESDSLIRRDVRELPQGFITGGVNSGTVEIDENYINLLGYAWNKLYRRSLLYSNGFQFEQGLKLIEDIDFNSRVLQAAKTVVTVPQCFVHYVQRTSQSLGKARDADFLRYRKRAINLVDMLLEKWGVSDELRNKRIKLASGAALWTAIVSAEESSNAIKSLESMLIPAEARQLVVDASGIKGSNFRSIWATNTLSRGYFRLALLPVYFARKVKQVKFL